MEIGDSFKIVLPKGRRKKDKWHSCKTPDKEFIITRVSKGDAYVYYTDLRTNISCNCNQCSPYISIFGPKGDDYDSTKKKVHKDYVVITQRKAQREREIRLRLILRN